MPEGAVVDTPAAPPPARRPLRALGGAIALVALWGVLQLWGLGIMPFHTHGEAREGLVVWQMTHGGGWILPLRDGPSGIEVPSKPPLFHWMGALTALAHGRTDEWSIRFPSAVLSLAGALTTYAAGTALWGAPAGWFGATITLTSFEWQRAATGARVDMTLTFGLLVAFFAYLFFLRSGGRGTWLVPFYGGMAFAVLAKGPVGVALPALQIGAACLVQRDLSPLRRLRLVRGLGAVALIAGLWYILAAISGGFAFFWKQVLNENVFRMFDSAEYEGGHRHSALYLVGGLATGFVPWTLLLPGPIVALWRERRRIGATDPRVYLLLWTMVVFALYSFAVSKRSVYLLSLYPGIGLLCGWWWATIGERGAESPEASEPIWLRISLRVIALTAMGAVLMVGTIAAVEAAGVPALGWLGLRISAEAAWHGRWVGEALRRHAAPSLLLLAAAAASLWWVARAVHRSRWQAVFVALLAAVSAATLLISHIVMPQIAEQKTYRRFMPAVRQAIGDQAALSFYRTFEYGAVFYWEGHIATYEGELSHGAPRYVLMAQQDWERAASSARQLYEPVTLPADVEAGDERRLILVRRRDTGAPPAARKEP